MGGEARYANFHVIYSHLFGCGTIDQHEQYENMLKKAANFPSVNSFHYNAKHATKE